MSDVSLGLILLGAGVGIIILTFVILRFIPGMRQGQPLTPATLNFIPPDMDNISDALLLVQQGGRIVYSNVVAREWFGYHEAQPELERLARRARPSDTLFALCAAEGQARFSLDNRLVEGFSYTIPLVQDGTTSSAQLVLLRRPQVTAIADSTEQSPDSTRALDIIADLSQKMTASLELETTLYAILESIDRLIPNDFIEITRYDMGKQHLVPYRFVGLGPDRRLQAAAEMVDIDHGYAGYLYTQKQPLLIEDVDAFREVRPAIDRKQYPFNAYLGIPLIVGGNVVGTLELASLGKSTFTENDLAVLRILSGPAAVALNNALLFEEGQERILELSGLATLSRAVSDLHDTRELYERLVAGISPLVPSRFLGFLIYDENRHTLEAQSPFQGIPEQMVGLYNITIQPDSPAEAIWESRDTLLTANAQEDQDMVELGLHTMAIAAGIQNSLLVTLNSSGRRLGYLQVADKLDGTALDDDDVRLIEIVANQAAATLENILLIRESQERAQRSESLRRIASLSGSTATLDEILTFSLREVARLLRADLAAIFLLEENIGELRVHKESLFGINHENSLRLGHIAMTDPDFRQTVTGSRRSFLSEDIGADERIIPLYWPLVQVFQMHAMINVPLIVRGQAIGEVMLCSQAVGFFQENDVTMVATTASQLALAIEKSALYNQTDESLRRRVVQLLALTRISRELNTTLDWRHLLRLVHDEVVQTTQADCGSTVLVEKSTDSLKIVFTAGDVVGETLSHVEEEVLRTANPRLIDDYAGLENPNTGLREPPPHQGVQSALLVPIAYQGEVVGLISMHSHTTAFFDKTALEIVQSLAVQAAIALGNAQRYQDQMTRSELLNRRVETMTALLETSRMLQAGQPLDESLEAIAFAIQNVTPFNVVLISVYDRGMAELQRVASAGIPLPTFEELKQKPQRWENVSSLLLPEFRQSNSYLIPADRRSYVLSSNVDVVRILPDIEPDAVEDPERTWQPDDVLIMPLLNLSGEPVGLISVDAPRDSLRPDRSTIESMEIFASQATFVIDTYNRYVDLQMANSSLSEEVQRINDASDHSRRMLPMLLHKDLEQNMAIQHLNQQTRRLSMGLNLGEIIGRQQSRSDVLLIFARELLSNLEMDQVLVAEMSEGGPRLLHAIGSIPSSVNPQALLGQRNPLRTVMSTGKPLYIENVAHNPEWQSSPMIVTLEASSFICLPVVTGFIQANQESVPQVDSAVLLMTGMPVPQITDDDRYLYSLLCRQASSALQNLSIVEETNRRFLELNLLLEFSRQIGDDDAVGMLRNLVESIVRVVPTVHAGWVALWDEASATLLPQVAIGYPKNEFMLQVTYKSGEALPGQVFATGEPMMVHEVNFAQMYNLSPAHILKYRDATAARLPVSSLVVPLQALTTRMGVIVLDNFTSVGAFRPDDLSLVSSLSQQVAVILSNLSLVKAAENRATQLQALTEVAGSITSSLDVNDLTSSLLDQVKTILPFDTSTLWLRQEDKLTVQAAQGTPDSGERVGISVDIKDSLLLHEMVETSQPVFVGDVRVDARFPSLVEPQYLSWLGVPLLSKGEVSGVLVLEKIEAHFYKPDDVQLILTFAGQAAVALENANLYQESLRRAQELDERSQRMALLNRLSTSLSESLDLTNILSTAGKELFQALPGENIAIALLQKTGEVVVHVEEPAVSPELPYILPGAALIERLKETLGVFAAEDILEEQDLEDMGDFFQRYAARSLLVLPMVVGSELVGLSFIYKQVPYRYTPDEVALGLTINNQVAVALQNARLFEESERLFNETRMRSTELSVLFDLGVNLTQVREEQRLLDLTFNTIHNLMAPDAVLILLVENDEQMVAHFFENGERQPPQTHIRRGASYSEHVLKSNQPLLIKDTRSQEKPAPGVKAGIACNCWLGVPLVRRGKTVGVLSVQSYTANEYGESHLRLVEQVANQLSVAIDNAQLFSQVETYAAELEQRVDERTQQVAREHRRMQSLLQITTELSASLDLDMVLNRTLNVINESIGAEHSSLLLLQSDTPSLFIRAGQGYVGEVAKGGQESFLHRTDGLAGWAIANRAPVLVADTLEDTRWIQRPDRTSMHRSAMAIPLLVGEETLGVLMLYHREVNAFSLDQLEMMQATAKQIAVALNNAQLYGLIRDQAERLGEMLRTQHVETSRSQAILEAVADGVLVTDSQRKVTLFNASAERILNLKRGDIVSQPLDHMLGLFGGAGAHWLETISRWSADPASYRDDDLFAEQFELENRRVISVHLSPVRLRNNFLGTVSIFRDITHQVEVDRLKSEFVATVSHELRTPMTSIKGYVDIMLMGAAGQLSPQQNTFLNVVKQNTERLSILVNDLLDVSRIEAGKVDLSMQSLDVGRIIGDVVGMFKRRSEDENHPIHFQVDVDLDVPKAWGDEERVRQVIENLVENAYQYTQPEGSVTVRLRQVDGDIQTDIIDSGIGVKPGERERIFERFYRGDHPLVYASSGNGLGLAIVKTMVEMHSGRLWFDSSGVEGEGSTFSFTLPVYEYQDSLVEKRPAAR